MASGLRLGFGGDAGSRAGGGSCVGGSVAEGTHGKKAGVCLLKPTRENEIRRWSE